MITMSSAMQRPRQFALIIGVVLTLALLSGCTAMRLAYNQSPTIAYWWLDDYVDFDDAQTPRVREAMNAWLRWHRNTQLAGDYVGLLQRAQAQVRSTEPMTGAEVCRWYGDVMARLDPMIDRALPLAVPLVKGLAPEQLATLEKAYEKKNDKFRDEYLQKDRQDRLEAAVKRAVKHAETLYGDLDDAQEQMLAEAIEKSPFDPEAWLAEKKLRQREAVETLGRLVAQPVGDEQTLAALRTLVGHARKSPRPEYRAYQQKLHEYNCAMAARLHNGISPKQRQKALDKLKGWEDDARALAAEP
jgi:hypothetical protein